MEGAHRFLKRLWTLAVKLGQANADSADLSTVSDTRRVVHQALQKALFDYERQQYNTVVSACMSMVNVLNKLGDGAAEHAALQEGLSIILRLLAPIAPHITHELWRELGYGEDILQAGWPELDKQALQQDQIEVVVQVNGKVRAKIQVAADTDKTRLEASAKANDNVQRFIADKTIRKVIVVPGKLVNVVAN